MWPPVRTAERISPTEPVLSGPRRRSPQVLVWATVGAVMAVVIVQGWTRWLLSGDLRPSPGGADRMPGWKVWVLHTFEYGGLIASAVIVWIFLLRPLVRQRRLTFDGKLLIACVSMYFWDPLVNYYSFSFAFNTHWFNRGSWAYYIPGFSAPNADLQAQPILGVGLGMYIYMLFGAAIAGTIVLEKLRARYPQAGTARLFLVLAGLVFVGDVVVEWGLIVLCELWAVPAGRTGFALLGGSRYQFTLWQPILVAIHGVGLTAVRYFRDDGGRSFVERGLDDLRAPARLKGPMSFLALVGFTNVLMIGLFHIPFNAFVSLQTKEAPALPSYLRAGMCGNGTDYACPGEAVPVPSRTSLHISPDDPRLPVGVRARQGW